MTTEFLKGLVRQGTHFPPKVCSCGLRWSHPTFGHVMTAYPIAGGKRRCEWADGVSSTWQRLDLCCENLLREAFEQRP